MDIFDISASIAILLFNFGLNFWRLRPLFAFIILFKTGFFFLIILLLLLLLLKVNLLLFFFIILYFGAKLNIESNEFFELIVIKFTS